MNYFNQFLPNELIYSFGWTIFHSFWQGALSAIIILVGYLFTEKNNSKIRYGIATASLFFFLFCALITFIYHYEKVSQVTMASISTENSTPVEINGNSFLVMGSEKSILENIQNTFGNNLPLIVMVWFIGMFLFTLKISGGIYFLHKMRKSGLVDLNDHWEKTIAGLQAKLDFPRKVQVFESCKTVVPLAFGIIKPIILLPLGIMNGMSQTQIEAIIIHELAHLRRNDYLVNLIQCFAESIFFYHPAIWWISSIIRDERENCCDDMTVQITGNKVEYSKALYNLQLITNISNKPALALTGENSLLRRIKRMNEKNNLLANYGVRLTAFVIMLLLIGIATLVTSSPSSGNSVSEIRTNNASIVSFQKQMQLKSSDNLIGIPDSSKSKKKSITFTEKEGEEKVKYKAKLNNGKLEQLSINGNKVDDKELPQYQEKIDQQLKEFEIAEKEYKESLKKYRESSEKYHAARKKIRVTDSTRFNFNFDGFPFANHFRMNIDTNGLHKELRALKKHWNKDLAGKSFTIPQIVIPPIPPLPDNLFDGLNNNLNKLEFDSQEFEESMKEWKVDLEKEMKKLKEELSKQKWNNENFKMDMKEFGLNMKKFGAEMNKVGKEMKKFGKFMHDVKEELIADSFITSEDDIEDFELSKDQMVVNGQKVDDNLHKKYLAVYKKHFGKDLSGDNAIKFKD